MTTALQIAKKAIEIADQNPDYIYEKPWENAGCYYVDPRYSAKGSCLFGQALIAEGIDPDLLKMWEGAAISSVLVRLAERGDTEPPRDPEMLQRLGNAQIAQDKGTTWADAVAELREYLGQVKA